MTTEELAAAGLPAEPVVQTLRMLNLPKRRDRLLSANPGVTKMVRSGQMMKMSGMWMPMSETWSEQGQRDLSLRLLFSENLRLPRT
jgi:hypothetical protein